MALQESSLGRRNRRARRPDRAALQGNRIGSFRSHADRPTNRGGGARPEVVVRGGADARTLNASRRWGYRVLPGDFYSYILHMRPAEWPIMAGHTLLGYVLAGGVGGGVWGGGRAPPPPSRPHCGVVFYSGPAPGHKRV